MLHIVYTVTRAQLVKEREAKLSGVEGAFKELITPSMHKNK